MRPDPALIAAFVLLGIAAAAWTLRAQVEEASQGGALPWLSLSNLAEEAGAVFGAAVPADVAARNVAAFLAMIRAAEGTARASDPYRVMFGGKLWSGSMADHPRVAVQFTNLAGARLWTTAAGAYQFLAVSPLPGGGSTRVNTWDRLRDKLGLPDFGPASQDAAAVELIDEAGALRDVQAGRFDEAVQKVRRIWASLPGAGHAQPEKSITWARSTYAAAGGTFA